MVNLVLGVALVGAGTGAYTAINSDSTATAPTGSRTVTVAKGTVLATVSGSGSLVSPSDAGANFTTGGTLTEVKVQPGDKVAKGQVLAKVDPTSAEQSLTEQKAALTAAEADLAKAEDGQPVSGSGAQSDPSPSTTVDPSAVAQAEAQVAQAQNALDTAQQAVDGTVLTAPVSGTVASVEGAVGETVSGTSGSGSSSGSSSSSSSSSSTSTSTSTPSGFVVITNPTGMQVTASFSEADALKLKEGQAATVTLNADSEKVLNAKVLSVSSLSTSSSSSSSGGSGGSSSTAVQYAATLAINGSTADLRTGLSANVQVVTGEASNALHVSAAAVSGTGANRSVTVVNKDGSTQVVSVTVGLQGDTDDEITSGLTEGQQVQIKSVASTGNNGFPGGGFPGGGGGGGGGGRGGAGGGGGGRG